MITIAFWILALFGWGAAGGLALKSRRLENRLSPPLPPPAPPDVTGDEFAIAQREQAEYERVYPIPHLQHHRIAAIAARIHRNRYLASLAEPKDLVEQVRRFFR